MLDRPLSVIIAYVFGFAADLQCIGAGVGSSPGSKEKPAVLMEKAGKILLKIEGSYIFLMGYGKCNPVTAKNKRKKRKILYF